MARELALGNMSEEVESVMQNIQDLILSAGRNLFLPLTFSYPKQLAYLNIIILAEQHYISRTPVRKPMFHPSP